MCTRATTQHLNELMPFHSVLLCMHLQGVTQHGVQLAFEFWLTEDGAAKEHAKGKSVKKRIKVTREIRRLS